MTDNATQPGWAGWTADQWAASFRAQEPDDADPDPALDGEVEAALAAITSREERMAERKARQARDAQTRADRKRRRAPRFVDALRGQPILAELKAQFWAIGYPDRVDDALAELGSLIKNRRSAAYEVEHRPNGVTGATKARPTVTGPEAIIATFAKIGIEFVLAPTGGLVARTKGGVLPPEAVPQVAAVAPLVRAHLAGAPLACGWCGVPAVTLLAPDAVPSCGTAPDCAEPTDPGVA